MNIVNIYKYESQKILGVFTKKELIKPVNNNDNKQNHECKKKNPKIQKQEQTAKRKKKTLPS